MMLLLSTVANSLLALLDRFHSQFEKPKGLALRDGWRTPSTGERLLQKSTEVNRQRCSGSVLLPMLPIGEPTRGMNQRTIGCCHKVFFFCSVLPVGSIGAELKGITILFVIEGDTINPTIVPFFVGVVFVMLDPIQSNFRMEGNSLIPCRSGVQY